MKTFLKLAEGKSYDVEPSHDHAVVRGCGCPHCGADPFRVAGRDMRIADNDREYVAKGFCIDCEKCVGELFARPSTIFGLREDEAVLVHGRARVY